MENKGQNTHLLFDCGFFCHAKLCTLADLHQTSGFFGGHSERSATQICPRMSNTLPNDFVLVDSLAQRDFCFSPAVL